MIRYMLAVLCVVTIFSSPVSAQSGPFSGDPFIRFHIAREAFSNNFNRFNVGFESLKPVKSFEFFWGPEEHVFAPSLLLEPRVSDIGSVSGLIDEEGGPYPTAGAPTYSTHFFVEAVFAPGHEPTGILELIQFEFFDFGLPFPNHYRSLSGAFTDNTTFGFAAAAIPEPSGVAFLAFVSIGLVGRRRRRLTVAIDGATDASS